MNAIIPRVHEVDASDVGDAVSKTNWTVRIVAVPPGEAPLWVREKWVGVELPVARYSSARTFYAYGVLSLPRTWVAQWWGIVRGRAGRISGYAVESLRAVDILSASSPEAATWWRENTPHLIAPDRYLVFHEQACRIVDI
jgi:hypothetical protein